MVRCHAVIGLALMVAVTSLGCSEDDGDQTASEPDAGADVAGDVGEQPDARDPDRREAALKHSFGEQQLQAGQEITPCVQWSLRNEEAIYVNAVTLGNDGGFHHSNWFVVPESMYPGDDGYFDCSDRSFTELSAATAGTVLFAQSTQSREEVQRLPEGVVIKVPPRHKVVGGLHLLNVAPREVSTDLRMQLDLIHPGDVEVVATPFRLTYEALDIPADSEARFTGECDMASRYEALTGEPFDMQVYWVLPHYHELGNYFQLEIVGGPRDGEELFELAGFNAEANGQAFNPPVDMTGATGFRFTCGFDNPRAESVGWGIGDQEMCVMLGFADMGAMLDVSVSEDNEVVETRDGIVYNTGECTGVALPKSDSQAMPSDDEADTPMYVPPSADKGGEVEPIPDCVDTPADADAGYAPTLTNVKEQIFGPGCSFSACHNGTSSAAGLDLSAEDVHAELMGHQVYAPTDLPLVAPGDAQGSWLYRIMSECEPSAGDVGVAHMPRNSPTLLDADLVATVRDWIDQGALDD